MTFDWVIIIGMGGTGGYIAPHAARIISELPLAPKLVFCDGDIVEPKNINRQNFTFADVGKNKATALAERYSAAFGIQIIAAPQMLDQKLVTRMFTTGPNKVLLIDAVDNLNTRKLIHTTFKASRRNHVWISCGNEKDYGQVIMATPENQHRNIVELFPEKFTNEILERERIEHETNRCAAHAISHPQLMVTNLMAATIASTMIYQLLGDGTIPEHDVVFFDIYNRYRALKPTESVALPSPELSDEQIANMTAALESI